MNLQQILNEAARRKITLPQDVLALLELLQEDEGAPLPLQQALGLSDREDAYAEVNGTTIFVSATHNITFFRGFSKTSTLYKPVQKFSCNGWAPLEKNLAAYFGKSSKSAIWYPIERYHDQALRLSAVDPQ